MAGQPFNFAVSGQTDQFGNALLTVSGFRAGIMSGWNLALNIQGNAPQIIVYDGGTQIAAANAINGNAQLGVIYTYGSTSVQIGITGALPNTPIVGQLAGVASSDPADLSGLVGQTSLTTGSITAYDGPTLISEQAVSHASSQGFYPGLPNGIPSSTANGTFNVLNWASVLLGLRQTSGSPVLVTFRWFADPSGARLVGQRSLILSLDVVTAVATIPNLGPYLQVVVNGIGGGYIWNASLVASNRLVNDIYGGNFTPYLVEQYGVTSGPSVTNLFPFGTLYGGPIRYTVSNGGTSPGNVTVQIQSMGTDGTFHGRSVDFAGAVALNTVFENQVIVPPVPCQVSIASAATAGTYTYQILVWSSATGAT